MFETQEEARNEGDAIEEGGGGGGRKYTVSLALAGSILDNAQSAELRTYLAGQIARALAVFSVDEVIIFDDEGRLKLEEGKEEEFDTKKPGAGGGCIQLARILQFLECPQYLRKAFFPIHPGTFLLRTATFYCNYGLDCRMGAITPGQNRRISRGYIDNKYYKYNVITFMTVFKKICSSIRNTAFHDVHF